MEELVLLDIFGNDYFIENGIENLRNSLHKSEHYCYNKIAQELLDFVNKEADPVFPVMAKCE